MEKFGDAMDGFSFFFFFFFGVCSFGERERGEIRLRGYEYDWGELC